MNSEEKDKIVWLEQTPPSTSDTSSTLQNTQIESPTRTTTLNVTGQINPSSISIDLLQQSSTADVVWIEQNQSDENKTAQTTLGNINETPSITIAFDTDNTIESVERPTIFPDAKEWAFSEYTESSRADDEMDDDIDDADDDGSLMTLATTASDLQASHLHLRSRGVKWPAAAIVDGTIDPTTATIVAAVQAVSRVADAKNAEENSNQNKIFPNATNADVEQTTSTATSINTRPEIVINVVDYSVCEDVNSVEPNNNKQDVVKSDNSAPRSADVNTNTNNTSICNETNNPHSVNCNLPFEEKSNNVTPIETNKTNTIFSNVEKTEEVGKDLNSQVHEINLSNNLNNCNECPEIKQLANSTKDIEISNGVKPCFQPETQPNGQLNNILNDLSKIDNDYQLSKKASGTIEVSDIEFSKGKKQGDSIDSNSDNLANTADSSDRFENRRQLENDNENQYNKVEKSNSENLSSNNHHNVNNNTIITESPDKINKEVIDINKETDIVWLTQTTDISKTDNNIAENTNHNSNNTLKCFSNNETVSGCDANKISDTIKDSTNVDASNNSNQSYSNIKQNPTEQTENKSNNIVWITEENSSSNDKTKNDPLNSISNSSVKTTEVVSEEKSGIEQPKVRFQIPEESTQNTVQTEKKPLNAAEDNKTNEDYSEFIDEYERNLRRHTCETLDLVDRLCEKTTSEQPPAALTGNPNNINNSQSNKIQWNGEVFTNGTNIDIDFDSLSINPNLMANPIDCLMLPGRRLIILDNELGILLVNLETKQVIRSSEAPQSTTTKWRYPKCGAYVSETDQILVLAECCSVVQKPETTNDTPNTDTKSNATLEIPTLSSLLEPKPTDYNFFICRFDAKTLRLENRIEAPKFIRDKIVSQSQLCYVNETKCLYMAVSTPNDAFLYELNADCRWSEVYNRRGRTFSDLVFFAVIGPITELLVLETNKQHVLMLSIYESDVVAQKMMAVCERPNALAIDERGAVFAFDRVSACVAQHSRIHFDRLHNIALIDRAHCRLAAQDHLLAVLVRGFKQLKLYKY